MLYEVIDLKQGTAILRRLRQKLDLPADILPLDSQLVLDANHELTVYGHRGIGLYDHQEIRIRIRSGFAIVHGTELEITKMNPARVVIAGKILSLEMEVVS